MCDAVAVTAEPTMLSASIACPISAAGGEITATLAGIPSPPSLPHVWYVLQHNEAGNGDCWQGYMTVTALHAGLMRLTARTAKLDHFRRKLREQLRTYGDELPTHDKPLEFWGRQVCALNPYCGCEAADLDRVAAVTSTATYWFDGEKREEREKDQAHAFRTNIHEEVRRNLMCVTIALCSGLAFGCCWRFTHFHPVH